MLDERIVELIQADVDGELAVSERGELDTVLRQSVEARRFRDEMLRVARLMAELPQVEPPAGLTRRILDRIDLPARRRWLAVGTTWFQPASYGLAVAAGVLIAVGITQVTPTGSDDIQSLVGSMVRQGKDLPAAVSGQLGISGPGVQGSAQLKVLDQAWAIEFDLDSEKPVEVTVDLASAGLRFGGFADPSAEVEVIDVSGGIVRVVNQGSHRFVLFLRSPAGTEAGTQAVAVAVSRAGETLFEGRLQSGG